MDNDLNKSSTQPAATGYADIAPPAARFDSPVGGSMPGVAPEQFAAGEPQPEEAGDEGGVPTRVIVIAVVAVLFALACIGFSVYTLALPTTDTARVRDIFIIFMAFQSLLTGLALVVLMLQLARLLNLLQNEIKPILDSTNETVSHLRGTTVFLSNNLVEPVIKLNEYLAGFTQLISVLGLAKSKRK